MSEARVISRGPLACLTWGNPTDPPLLFLHGFMGCAADWESVAQALDSSFYCIAPDLPAHGQSHFDPRIHGDVRRQAVTVTDLLDALGLESVDAVGYSMGGRILLALACAAPQRLGRLVLVSTGAGIADTELREARQHSDAELAMRLQHEPFERFLDDWYDLPLFGAVKRCTGYAAMLQRRLANNPVQLARALVAVSTGRQEPLWDRLADIGSPALLLYGAQDDAYRDTAMRMALANPGWQCEAIADCSHALHVEQPVEFVDACKRFLEGEGID